MTAKFFTKILNFFFKTKSIWLIAICLNAFSCVDQGCIDADDFGEYESETIEVSANTAQNFCYYDASKELTDSAQSPALVKCFSSGSASVTDETGTIKETTSKGCLGFDDIKFRNICVDSCLQNCYAESSSGSGGVSQPNWVSTNKRASTINSGVTIRPGAEVIITATGEINLGDSVSYDAIYVKADNSLPNSSRDTAWNSHFFDINNGQSLNLQFSGKWNDGSKDIGAGSTDLSSSGNLESDAKIYNGAKKIIAYLIPHPKGYDFDSSQATEKLGAKSVPLLPDPTSWKCVYSGSGSEYDKMNESLCANNIENGYTSSGYLGISNSLAAEIFPVSSEIENSGLGNYGGFVKWKSEFLMPENRANTLSYDLLNSLTCSSTDTCLLSKSIAQDPYFLNYAKLLEQTAENGELQNPTATSSNKYAFKVSFRNINPACSAAANLKIKIINSSGDILSTGSPNSGNNGDYRTISINNSNWGSETDHIALESDQKILYNTSEISQLCRKSIVAKFRKYHDIEIYKSGFVSFTTLNAISGNCVIKGRIINPTGSFVKNGTLEPDFYEYGNFLTPSQEPTPASSPTDPLTSLSLTYSNITTSWTSSFFVRKGQMIRFSPESWDNTFTTSNGLTRQCGTGMAMKIEPRPALLCRGASNSTDLETIFNPECYLDYSGTSTTLIGCKAYAPECDDSKNSTYYCPEACRKATTCGSNGKEENGYKKENCTLAESVNNSSQCNIADSTTYTEASCLKCSNLAKSRAETPAKIAINGINKCYDLESYKGKVANIPINGFTLSDLENKEISKGATKLGSFNGSYGNFDNFSSTSTKDSFGNTIFQLKSPITFPSAGRLRFFVLDGSDFSNEQINNSYSNNSSSSSNYNGSNGLKISPTGTLTYSNGEWLMARLCKETNGSTYNCSGSDPVAFEGQPKIIEIAQPTIAGQKPVITSGYKFDAYGNIIKTASPTSLDCTLENAGTRTIVGSNFYCHTYGFAALGAENSSVSESDIENLRLTFQILDPEIANCNISNPTSTSGFDGIKLKNSYYEPQKSTKSDSGITLSDATENIGKICPKDKKPGPDKASECQAEFYCGNKYNNNSGRYYVNIKIKSPVSHGSSDVMGKVIKPIIEVMDGPEKNCSTTGSDFQDGVKVKNPNYNELITSNADQVCTTAEFTEGKLGCSKEYYCEKSAVGEAERVYTALIGDSRFKAITTSCLVLMITFYGMTYLMGLSEISHSELTNRVIKIGLIYLFIGENGWYWFDRFAVQFFKNGADFLAFLMASSFDSSPEIQSALETGNYYDKSILFSSVDRVFNMIFSSAVQKKVSALLFASLFGWAYLLIVISAFMLYISSVANALLLYLTSQVFMSILFVLGPIFFILTLFNLTKSMFDSWLKALIGFALQQIFLLTTLAFFNMLIYEVIKMSFGYKICWDEVWTINIVTRVSLLSFWTIASLPPRTDTQSQVASFGNAEGIPSLFSILFIWVIASLMNKFMNFMTGLAKSFSGGMDVGSLSKGVQTAAGVVKGLVDQAKSEAWKKSGAQDFMDRMDDKIFDHGKLADARKEQAKAERKQETKTLKAMKKAGNKAVEKFKGSAEYANLSDPEKEAKLKSVEKDAQYAAAKKINPNLKDEDIEKLRNQKGFSLKGTDSLTEAAGRYIYEKATGISHGTSLADKEIKTSLNSSEKKAILANKTKEEREHILQNVTFDRSNTGKLLKAGAEKINQVKNAGKAGIENAKELYAGASKAASAISNATSKAATSTYKLKDKAAREQFKENFALSAKAASQSLAKAAKSGAISAASSTANAASSTANATTKFAKEAVNNPMGTAYSAAKKAGEASEGLFNLIASVVEKATETPETKAYEQARQELVKSGVINDYKKGTQWAMSDAEKELVNQRKKENQKLAKAEKPEFDAEAKAATALEIERMNTYDEANEKDFPERVAMKFKAASSKLNPFSSKKNMAIAEAKIEGGRKSKSTIEGNIKSSKEDLNIQEVALSAQRAEIGTIKEAITNYQSSDSYKNKEKEIKKLEAIANKTFTKDERNSNPQAVERGERLARAAKTKIKNLQNSDPTLNDLNSRLRKSQSTYHTINDKKSKIEDRLEEYQKMLKEFPEEDLNDRVSESKTQAREDVIEDSHKQQTDSINESEQVKKSTEKSNNKTTSNSKTTSKEKAISETENIKKTTTATSFKNTLEEIKENEDENEDLDEENLDFEEFDSADRANLTEINEETEEGINEENAANPSLAQPFKDQTKKTDNKLHSAQVASSPQNGDKAEKPKAQKAEIARDEEDYEDDFEDENDNKKDSGDNEYEDDFEPEDDEYEDDFEAEEPEKTERAPLKTETNQNGASSTTVAVNPSENSTPQIGRKSFVAAQANQTAKASPAVNKENSPESETFDELDQLPTEKNHAETLSSPEFLPDDTGDDLDLPEPDIENLQNTDQSEAVPSNEFEELERSANTESRPSKNQTMQAEGQNEDNSKKKESES